MSDLVVPSTRDTEVPILADRLHDVMVRLNTAWFMVVDAERTYERERAQRLTHFTATGESPSAAEKLVRADTDLAEFHHQLVDARAHVHRLEQFAVHYRFLIEHVPGR